jgi:SAM-dependent methyltransferase
MGSPDLPDYAVLNRESWTRANAAYTDRKAHEAWSTPEIRWGMCHVPEAQVSLLPDLAGKDVVELGCGTAYLSAWIKRAGARRVVGIDVTPAQLETARRMDAEFGLGLELVEANAEETGLPGTSFDLVVSEYGASIWCDPYKWIPEAARLLRTAGELVFLRGSTLKCLCEDEKGVPGERLTRPQRGAYRFEWTEEGDAGVEFHIPIGEMIRVLRANGFEILDLVELYAPDDAAVHEYYPFAPEWAKKWPFEEIWRARKT